MDNIWAQFKGWVPNPMEMLVTHAKNAMYMLRLIIGPQVTNHLSINIMFQSLNNYTGYFFLLLLLSTDN